MARTGLWPLAIVTSLIRSWQGELATHWWIPPARLGLGGCGSPIIEQDNRKRDILRVEDVRVHCQDSRSMYCALAVRRHLTTFQPSGSNALPPPHTTTTTTHTHTHKHTYAPNIILDKLAFAQKLPPPLSLKSPHAQVSSNAPVSRMAWPMRATAAGDTALPI